MATFDCPVLRGFKCASFVPAQKCEESHSIKVGRGTERHLKKKTGADNARTHALKKKKKTGVQEQMHTKGSIST